MQNEEFPKSRSVLFLGSFLGLSSIPKKVSFDFQKSGYLYKKG